MCRLWPIFPVRLQTSIFGTAELNFCVRNGYRWTLCVNITDFYVSVDLSSRSVSRQVFSALQSLTSVFGMGTGGPSALKTLTRKTFLPKGFWVKIEYFVFVVHLRGLEPRTHWLRVSCSTSWAKGAFPFPDALLNARLSIENRIKNWEGRVIETQVNLWNAWDLCWKVQALGLLVSVS